MEVLIPINILIIEEDGFHLQVNILINNKPARFLIDTGASKTVFDINTISIFIEDIKPEIQDALSTGLGTNTMLSHKAKINRFKIGQLEIFDFDAVLLDLSHVNKSYTQLGLPDIQGVLGGDLLLKYNAVINYREKNLVFEL